MNRIQHLIEPRRLLLSWQRPMAGKERRTRHIVGEIEQCADGIVFRYLDNHSEFAKAQQEGFKGFPAFGLGKTFHSGVLDAFMRRLPPRKREDFAEYLAQYRLPENFNGSDMALLAYTGAKLPGDGFELVPDLENAEPPIELVLEIAGFRHQDVAVAGLSVGDTVRLVPEPENAHDPEAIAIHHDAYGRIGYVPRPYCRVLARWLGSHKAEAIIDRLNGKPERPLVFLFVKVF
jgi:hypothetical protein